MLKIPGDFIYQSTPSTDMFKGIETLNTQLRTLNAILMTTNQSPLTETTFHTGPTKTDQERARQFITSMFLQKTRGQMTNFPKTTHSYLNALKYVEDNVLSTKLTATNIVAITKNVASHIFPLGQGQYRKVAMFIYDSQIMPVNRTQEDFKTLDRFYAKEENKDVYPIWKEKTRTRLWDKEFAEVKIDCSMDKDDEKCLRRISITTPEHEQVASLMNELEQAITSTDDCYKIAARIHQIIVGAHPFYDGNGRTARIMMNTVLMQAGKSPLLLDSEEKYTDAVRGTNFEGYIRDLATRQPKCEKVVTLALRFLFDCHKREDQPDRL